MENSTARRPKAFLCQTRSALHSLVTILRTLPDGVTELGCHPGKGNDLDLDTMYRGERAQELKTLCDPLLPTIIKSMEIEFRSFGNLPVGYWRGSPVHV